VARICKELHPGVPVIFGGLSASYFHEELVRYPQVDFVLRGDSTEAPLHRLLEVLRRGESCADVPNLTWKQGDEVRVNPHGYLPDTLDYVDPRPEVFAGMVLRHRDLAGALPMQGWLRNPMTAVLALKGCTHDCVTCGASRTTCTTLTRRMRPAFRSPASLVANMSAIARFSRAPIYLVGDVLQAGADAAHELLERLQRAKLANEIVFEFLDLPSEAFVRDVARHVERWGIEISPDSHDPALRQAQDGEPPYGNEQMEAVFSEALRRNCRRIEVFFMIGLPGQTRASVLQTVDYCERLFQLGDARLACFISPMGPFLDPGSRGFEDPERYGYRLFARTLEEHRQLLVQPTWESMLNYETRWMTRRELVDATYDAAERLNALKERYRRIPRREARAVARRIAAARSLRARLDAAGTEGAADARAELEGEIRRFSVSTVCDKRELFGPRHLVNFRPLGLARLALANRFSRRPTSATVPAP
jgi:B12-binding domain/radical SAM domain protein